MYASPFDIMKNSKRGILGRVLVICLAVFCGAWGAAQAQSNQVDLDISVAPEVAAAQTLGLTNLGVSRTGAGERLVTIVMRNNEGQDLKDLYFAIDISTGKRGLIVDLDQEQGRPFTLPPTTIVTDNNSLQDGISGIKESIHFESDPLTSQGEDLINSLEGSTELPQDTYQVTVYIYQGNNGRNGGELMAKKTISLGGRSTGGGLEIFLLTPGGTLGSDARIQNEYPEFNWDGSSQVDYRLLVVEDNGDGSAESLMQGAQSTEPVIVNDRSGTGSLLSYENVDVIVSNQTNYPFPSSGVQPLRQGKTYFWQVIAQVKTPSGVNQVYSDIWSFKLGGAGNANGGAVEISSRQMQQLIKVIGQEEFKRLKEEGYQLQTIQYDGQNFQGSAAGNALVAFLRRLSNNEVKIISRQ
jgi:hypothetical protein